MKSAPTINDNKPKGPRLYNSTWEKYAKAFLMRNPLCAECHRQELTKLAQCVDHIIPHRGDRNLFWETSNHQPLCNSCHSKKTNAGL